MSTFYKEEKFKETPIGKIPEDWEVVRLGDVITYIKGKKPKTMTEENRNGYLPYLSTDYLRSGKPTQFVKITENEIIVRDGDIILLWDGSNAGEFFLGKKGVLSSTMVRLNLREGYYNDLFLFYLLKKKEAILKDQTRGTGIPHVDKNVFKGLITPLPPLEEQEAIAKILSIVDLTIQKTNEIIAKTECLKKGLMQELLTKGIGHKEFKDTEIGRIPKEWEVVRLEDIARVKRGASPRPKGDPRYFGGEIPWIKISDISKYKKGIYLTKTDDTVTEEGKRKSVYVYDGTLIISNSGTIGEPTIIMTGKGGCIHDGIIALSLLNNVDKMFLYYFFDYKKNYLQQTAQKGTQGNMNTRLWRSIKVQLPPFSEQKKIAEILSTVDKKLEVEKERKEKLERIKKALMDLLLTGKIRVRVN